MNQNFTHPKTQLAHRTRREFLNTTASGLGMAALGSMLTADNLINAASVDDAAMSVNPLAPRQSHFDPKAKAWIFSQIHRRNGLKFGGGFEETPVQETLRD